jgi:hypothetical protein
MKSGIELIAEERQRQIEVEGWTPQHDDEHEIDVLMAASLCYETPEALRNYHIPNKNSLPFNDEPIPRPKGWPWSARWWKPTPNNRTRELIKAGALYAAQIDVLKRRMNLIAEEIDGLNKPWKDKQNKRKDETWEDLGNTLWDMGNEEPAY